MNPPMKKGPWSEEEVCRLREVFQPGEDYKMAVQEIVEYFPSMCVLGWICDQRCVCVTLLVLTLTPHSQ